MKSFLSISLALLILLSSAGRVFIVLDYQLNKDYIAKVLCINRDKPKLGCQGKCHLKKQLQKADEHEKKTGNSQEGKSELPWLCSTAGFFLAIPALVQSVQQNSFYQASFSVAHLLGILQPPQF